MDEPDHYNQTPLFYAVGDNQLEIVRKYGTKGTKIIRQIGLITLID